MSMEERTGIRSLIYSAWHRPSVIRRYLGARDAARLTMIDIDACEACCICSEPIALIETEKTSRPKPKRAPITAALARLAHIQAYSVAYSVDADDVIESFRVQRIQPHDDWVSFMWPADYAKFLLGLREQHNCGGRT